MYGQLDPQRHEWARYEQAIIFDEVCNWCTARAISRSLMNPYTKFKFGTLQ